LEQVFLSDAELYFTDQPVADKKIVITGDESHHLINVMRHQTGDTVFITDGIGNIYKSEINVIEKKKINCTIVNTIRYTNDLSRFWFCLPRLKNPARLEFALEKCVELGITKFIIFDSKRTVAKGGKIDRWEKILLSAMKQSLRSWLPKIFYVNNLSKLFILEGPKILFDQNAGTTMHSFLPILNSQFADLNCYFIFGPEGGLSEEELKSESVSYKIKLTDNRLRSETSIVTAASFLAMKNL